MIKRFEFSSIREDGEPLVIPVDTDLSKHASSVLPELVEYLHTLPSPAEDMIRTVITALSSFEGFGPNRNGDAWLEDHLLRENTYTDKDGRTFSAPMYKSFESFARPYKYHINRPDSPAYGNVLKAFYNPGMKRVELVVEWDRKKAPDICERLENYEPVSTSIGFRCMPVDVCSVCGNPAKTRREYCSHLKKEMLQIRSDGRIVCAINPKGMFFDISMVDDPADRTSRAVEVGRVTEGAKYEINNEPIKVASASWQPEGWMSSQFSAMADMAVKIAEAMPEEGEEKVAADLKVSGEPVNPGGTTQKIQHSAKVSDIIKRVRAEVELGPKEIEAMMDGNRSIKAPKMTKEELQMLSRHPVKHAVATATMLGIDLYPEEVQYIGLYPEFPKLADKLYDENLVVVADSVEPWAVNEVPMDTDLAEKLAESGIVAKRSLWQPWRVEQMVKDAYFGENPYTPATPVPADQLYGIVGRHGMTTAQKMGLMASLFMGAHLTLGDNPIVPLPGTPTQRALVMIGLAGLAGFFAGRGDGKEIARMPIMDFRRKQLEAKPAGFNFRQALSAPLAYNMLFGKTAGVLTNALRQEEDLMKVAAARLSAMKPFLRTEKRIKLGGLDTSELIEFYEEPLLDAMLLNRAAGSY